MVKAMTTPTTTRIRSLDGLRALACLAVFCVHLQQATGLTGQLGPIDLKLLMSNGNTGVCLLLMLSAFLLSLPFWRRAKAQADPAGGLDRTQSGLRWVLGYAKRRILRIVPAYYLCLAALVLVGDFWRSDRGLAGVLLHATFLHNMTEWSLYSISPPFWTLAVQVQFYVLFPVLILFVRPLMRARLVATGVLGLGAVAAYVGSYSVGAWASSAGGNWPFDPSVVAPDGLVLSHTLLAHLPHFFIGMIAAGVYAGLEASDARPTRPGTQALVADVAFWGSLAAVAAVLSVDGLSQALRVPFGRYNLPYVPLLMAVMMVSAPLGRLAGAAMETLPLRMLGMISYGFYIFHRPCMGVVSEVMRRAKLGVGDNAALFAAASLVLAIVVSALSYKFVERPVLARLRRAGREHGTRQ